MHGIDVEREFVPVGLAILTVSDTRTNDTDTSGDILAERVRNSGHKLEARKIVPDDIGRIREAVEGWISDPAVDVIVTTGGTGLTGRDVTPEAVLPLLEKQIDGFSVIFHHVSFQSVGLSTLQSRACAGVAAGTFIFCLPGSNGAVKDGWDKIISLQLDARHRPCNLVEIMPRLGESA
jgi:molybdopterin adenylyltransferase